MKISEVKFQRELNLAAGCGTAAQLPERRVAGVASASGGTDAGERRAARRRQEEGRRIAEIEKLGAKLQLIALSEIEALEYGDVRVFRSRTARDPAGRIAKLLNVRAGHAGSRARHGQCTRVEIPIHTPVPLHRRLALQPLR